jgi:hypothetical protein
MLSVRTASGRLSYLLTRLQFQQFILFEWGPRVLELQIAFAETMSGLIDGTIPAGSRHDPVDQCRDDRNSEHCRDRGRTRDISAAQRGKL